MGNWERCLLNTERVVFEIFIKGKGTPLCVTHHYSVFNQTGDYFAESFTRTNKVFLVNLRETGYSEKAKLPYQLSMLESIFDLEAIREELGLLKWGFAGHSTGGMLGIIYGIYFSDCLNFSVLVGTSAREYMTFSKDCIYNPAHPQFYRMQELNETLKRSNLSSEYSVCSLSRCLSWGLYRQKVCHINLYKRAFRKEKVIRSPYAWQLKNE